MFIFEKNAPLEYDSCPKIPSIKYVHFEWYASLRWGFADMKLGTPLLLCLYVSVLYITNIHRSKKLPENVLSQHMQVKESTTQIVQLKADGLKIKINEQEGTER